MNILLLSHKFYPNIGGIETVSEMLANEFIEAGQQVRVATWSVDATDKKFSFEIVRNPNVFELFKQHIWADVVFENNPSLRLSWPNILVKTPIVIALHTWLNRSNGNLGWQDKLKQIWLNRAFKVISCSSAIKRKNFSNSIVIENAYNNSLFKQIPTKERNKDFVFLGRLVSDKGADILINSFAKLNNNILSENQYSLTLIGDGEEKQNLIHLAKELKIDKRVQFTGSLTGNELVKRLNGHKYIVVPSVWEEPFGLVALEGMACGCLPIVSNGGGLPDAIGKAGVTFRSGDVNDLVKVLKNLMSHPELEAKLRNEMTTHLAEHTSTVVARKYLKIIEKAANRS